MFTRFSTRISFQSHFRDRYYFILEITYTIKVKTGNVAYADTRANVYLKVFGERDVSGILSLNKSLIKGDLFQIGKTDILILI